MKTQEIAEVVRLHGLWLAGQPGGKRADLPGADLTEADLRGANLRWADLTLTNLPPLKTVLPEGDFTAYKKVRCEMFMVVLTLLVPADAARTGSLVGRKCRADKVRVISASVEGGTFYSLHRPSFTYKMGEVVTEPNYNGDVRVECTKGIHFFLTREEAENYTF